ncbi:DUF1080 domain-containing protein [Lentisphaera marina]|uniref:3-keto-disaccharide hydrolase n=1 Tax=Lentisphaera marina TaxID=1111041 RepID=UPI00236693E5|nr:DUF1080 domain-containing protein [Lentisphaera marina]MDD7986143.1 DUF1080 domain-containing protein [Lentisphaera marina]
MKVICTVILLVLSLQSEDKWLVLFDGTDLNQWQKSTGNWQVDKNETLLIQPRKGESGWERYSSYLYTKKQFSDFTIEFEYSYPKGGNSGLYFRVADMKDATKSGMEVQILDSLNKKGKLSHHDHGGVIKTVAPSKNMSKPAGYWFKAQLSLKGRHILYILDGEKIIDHDFSKNPNTGKKPLKGYIALQDHGYGNDVRFRNIRIKEIK